MEIISGLSPGDRVIVTDMSAYAGTRSRPASVKFDGRSILRFIVDVVDHNDGHGTLLLHYL
jgi:hypothetical protein